MNPDPASPDYARVRCVVFDAVGTLIVPSPSAAEAYDALGRQFGSTLDRDEVGRRFHSAMARHHDPLGGDFRTSPDRERQRWAGIVADVFAELPDTAELFEQLWRHFAQPGNWRLLEDARQTIARFNAAGLSWAVASNFDDRLAPLCARLPPLDTCRHLFISARIGYRKPAPEFFRHVERALQLPPAALLFVGDDPACDYLAPQAAGWQSLLFRRDRPSQHPRELQHLAALADLLTPSA